MNKFAIGAASLTLLAGCAGTVKVLNQGLGSGAVTSNPAGINCTGQCQGSFAKNSAIELTATASAGSTFAGWGGDCSGSAMVCSLLLDRQRSATARFDVSALPRLTAGPLSGEVIRDFLAANPAINTPGRFVAAIGDLPAPFLFRDNWILMARSESLQTGHAASPRVILPSQDSRSIFSFAMTTDPGFPHADPFKIEYIQFDGALRRFRFHEIDVAARTVTLDARGCFECHAGRPNWDSYDSWGGMLPFNRDRVYKGSVDAAALRSVFNLWGKTGHAHEILEQLNLPSASMTRVRGGPFDGHVQFPLIDDSSVVIGEPAIGGLPGTSARSIGYPPSTAASNVIQGGPFFHLFNSVVANQADVRIDAEGRGVDLFDQLTPLNGQRIAQELIDHPRTPVDVRPIALAVASSCNPNAWLTPAQGGFFNARNRVAGFADVSADTTTRRRLLPKLKVELQRQTLMDAKGLLATYGSTTALGATASEPRQRQEIFRRPIDLGAADQNTGAFVDRELIYDDVAQFRYLLEPLGVQVSKWSMSVSGRSRTYSFADLFSTTTRPQLVAPLAASLGLPATPSCAAIEPLVRAQFASLPPADQTPSYREVQKIFDAHCLRCHGSFSVQGGPYPPSLVAGLSHSQLLRPPAPTTARVVAGNPPASRLYQRIEAGTMPPSHDGPPLSGADLELIRRWIVGGALDVPSTTAPPQPTCTAECRTERNDCMDGVGQPGAPTAAACAQAYQACVRQCTTRGCSTSQRCCEPGLGDAGCRLCVPRNASCP